MRKLSLLFIFIFSLILTFGCSKKASKNKTKKTAEIAIDDSLRLKLQTFLEKKNMGEHLGFYLYDLTADRPIYGYREEALMPPASCLKLLTGLTFIKLLGTEYYYKTGIYTKGQVKGDTLMGDATFKGSFDPQFKAPDLDIFFQKLRQKGIRHIKGNVLVDLAHNEFPTPEPHWYPGDLAMYQYGLFYQHNEKILREIHNAMNRQGVHTVKGEVCLGKLPKGSKGLFFFKHDWKFTLRRAWKNSSNTQSTGLLYTLGSVTNSDSSFRQSGVCALKRFIKNELQDTSTQYVIHDGCGLCPENRVPPTFLVKLLHYGYKHPASYWCLRVYLPISSIDGTLRRELPKPDMRGKIQAKTGTLSHPYGISTLAGYCTGKNGHLLAFAIMNKEISVLDARPLQEKLCEMMLK